MEKLYDLIPTYTHIFHTQSIRMLEVNLREGVSDSFEQILND